ncbi:MAG: protein kinase family protein [Verrucomicrobia bacterium]|nr:protein kinase family protein [Verrucomicrobiota bacterium]
MAASSSPRIQGHQPIDISSTLRANPNLDISEEEFAKTTSYVNAIENYLTPKFHHYSRHTFPIERSFLARRKEEVTSGYIFLDRITDGTTQKLPVKFGLSLDGRAVVVKSLPAAQVRKTELAIQKKLRQLDPEKNYYIIGPIVTYRNFQGIRKIAQILDLKQGGDLLDYFNHHLSAKGTLSNKLIYPIAYKMARMLSILHKNGIVHLDIKLENFLMENDEVFLSDFGHSHFTDRRLRQVWGSPGYQDPTSYFKEKKIKAKPEMDVWSMGICLSILKHGAEFQRWMGQMDGNYRKLAAMDEIEFSWAKAKYLPNRWNPDSLDYIINQCLTLDPKARPTAEAVSEFVLGIIQKRKTLP